MTSSRFLAALVSVAVEVLSFVPIASTGNGQDRAAAKSTAVETI
jgi:hypothetical protein